MKSTLGYLFFLALTASLPAQGAIMTFNGTAADTDFELLAVGDTYSEAGFTLEAEVDNVYFIDNDADSGGVGNVDDLSAFDDDVLEQDNIGAAVTVVRDGGGLFDAIDADIGQLDALGSLLFTGFLGGIAQSSVVLNSCGDACIQSLAIGLMGIDELRIEATALFPVIDNLQLVASGAVPEPQVMMMLGLGVLTLVALRRRQVVG